jgi:hypothetical protein
MGCVLLSLIFAFNIYASFIMEVQEFPIVHMGAVFPGCAEEATFHCRWP